MAESQSNNGANAHPGFGERVDQIGSSAQRLWSDTRSAVEDLSGSLDLKGRTQRHPYGMVLAALGVGYVIGGGLFTSVTARLVRLGVRLAALPLVRDELLGIAESALNSLQRAAPSPGDKPQ